MSGGSRLNVALAAMPVVAILRGLRADEAVAVVGALYDAGIRVAEVPLNSPDPFRTIGLLCRAFGDAMVVGAGTVTAIGQVGRLAECGAALCVSPNTDAAVIGEALRLGMIPLPGCATPTEAFSALAAGARHLKYFPAGGHEGDIAALRAVLPDGIAVLAVGGVRLSNIAALRAAGCAGFGIGADLYVPRRTAEEVGACARALVHAARHIPCARLLANPGAIIGESPVLLNDTLVWTDPVRSRLYRFAGGRVAEAPVDAPIFGLAALDDTRIAGTLESAFCTLDGGSGPAAAIGTGCRFNDLAIDPAGGLWGGTMHKAILAGRGAIFHAPAPDAPPRRVAQGLGVPNGMAFSEDGRTLFVVDTLARTLVAYPADVPAGSLGEPVILSDFMNVAGKPDGMTRASDGRFFVAMWGGGCVAELAPDGALLRTISVPAPNPSSVALDGDTLYVTSSRMRLAPAQLGSFPASGGLFAIDLTGG
ncbi:2-dehydro-3-deoxy-6-phosphogalactonate aldolase [Sphingomonas hengshuiensis]|uniref:2-dehydro-3-deoxy-6-phosphogalactonate aldolase n=1 Tax=Sphingomonas hengshuiensis TaxID=1609977 RepID=UPI000B133BE6|nr:2-dehydro-3-deoxy-6-phosphogalactonate aldolase [Sphingomonas hengshuiensis]